MAAKKTIAKASKQKRDPKAPAASRPAAAKPTAEAMVTIDARSNKERRKGDRREKGAPVAVERRQLERRTKVSRRRQIDPTTCERDYSPEEIEFMAALDAYKRRSGRMFPTCSEVLEVIKGLGYEKSKAASDSADLPADAVVPVVPVAALPLPQATAETAV